MKVKRLYEEALLPTKATEGSAAFDLYAYTEAPLEPQGLRLKSQRAELDLYFPAPGFQLSLE